MAKQRSKLLNSDLSPSVPLFLRLSLTLKHTHLLFERQGERKREGQSLCLFYIKEQCLEQFFCIFSLDLLTTVGKGGTRKEKCSLAPCSMISTVESIMVLSLVSVIVQSLVLTAVPV